MPFAPLVVPSPDSHPLIRWKKGRLWDTIPPVMIRSCLTVALTLLLTLSAWAQTPSQSQPDDRLASDPLLRPYPSLSFRPVGVRERQKFFEAVPQFRAATAEYREGIGLGRDLSKPLKAMEKLIEPLREYFNGVNASAAPVDLSGFQQLPLKDLLWETLTTAENVDNNLQVAFRAVQQSERDGIMDIKVLQFFSEIQDDLTRLRFLTSKIRKY